MLDVIHDKLLGCLVGGAVGDAVGSFYESGDEGAAVDFEKVFCITDDTQLTLATCEAIVKNRELTPDKVATSFLNWYNRGRLRGLGASTLKALRDLQMGAHWGLSGRSGEYAAGNGAAMRIAPLAFVLDVPNERQLIRDICRITHKNEEAYVGALCILYLLHDRLADSDTDDDELMKKLIAEMPDTKVRDHLILLQEAAPETISSAGKLVGTSGYVASSVPFAIFAALQLRQLGFRQVITEIIQCGGDTDTNASLAGQIMGTAIGFKNLPPDVLTVFNKIEESSYILELGNQIRR
ncbi:ADP-ribosylglycohydrolase [Chitinophaga terrae (ex Kim and Jung 2007)]|uniref:ADP-ribosylglycohydrolase n=1 Tax=Chitinophaga terrae (ex Kim and Jung 2007) TaxID=408074 RepID=A0A1H4G9W2_9BACT|nr:ADP-ribosylglycohydrolase family protein [Chitinophaga terrae (ex Kim and Jung 2007)]GEP93246.1 dinitrogenase reductase activating glycohydrolase (draG) [Chitinophaga terrae (ex Kim and Jung 2007)]SEB06443.1 ADP-ribosylglycohydrolase [Chitinophaga terrae (ex Kim and Jung 2007)]